MIILSINGFSQEESFSEIITSIAENLASEASDPEAVVLFTEQLNELSQNPVGINSGDETEISRLFFLSDFQIKAIADYTKLSGKIISVYELSVIPGFDRQTVEIMIPFIILDSKVNSHSDSIKLRQTLLTNLIISPGENDTSYTGSPLKVLSKYKFTAGRFTGGFTIEKDQGEKFLIGSSPYPDFISGYLSCTGSRLLKRIIIGDFSSRFGQGININTGFRTGLTLTAPGYMSGRDEIRPYTSTDENNFFRGAAAEFTLKRIGLSLFFSSHLIDATTCISTDSTHIFIENLYKTGLHNTSFLLSKKDVVSEKSAGMNLTYNFKFLRIGVVFSHNRFSIPFYYEKNKPENLYKFEGMNNNIYSFHYNSLIKRLLLFGEISASNLKYLAVVQGFTLRASDRLSINLLYRNYSPGFTSFHANGPGRGSSVSNEYGILGNFTFEAAKNLFISAGCDVSYFLWLRYRCSFPSNAVKKEIKVKYIPDENLTFDLSYVTSQNEYDDPDGQGIAGIKSISNGTYKALVKYSPLERISLSIRIDYKIVYPAGSKGMLLLQDCIYRFRQVPVTLWFRYCIFKTDDWDSRLYTYENDLLYSFSIPALSGEGSRSYLMTKWEIGDIAELRFKYGLTSFSSNKNGNNDRDEIKLQFRVWF
jgi:hypothetical protein